MGETERPEHMANKTALDLLFLREIEKKARQGYATEQLCFPTLLSFFNE